jgi:hypothetical protein
VETKRMAFEGFMRSLKLMFFGSTLRLRKTPAAAASAIVIPTAEARAIRNRRKKFINIAAL